MCASTQLMSAFRPIANSGFGTKLEKLEAELVYHERPKLDGETTLPERLKILRDRYYIIAGALVLLLGIGLSSSAVLAWTAGVLLALLTINVLLPRMR